MSESRTEIHAEHPLFRELRNGLLWHRTSAMEYRQICADGLIKPNDGRQNRWRQRYACQQLGGISLFDFTTESEENVLVQSIKWGPFLGDAKPVTVILGMDRKSLPGRLCSYTEIMSLTSTGNAIPCVEVCHCGAIPASVVATHLLVCAANYSRFRKFDKLDGAILAEAELELAQHTEAVRLRS